MGQGAGSPGLPGHRRVVEHDHSLHAEQGGQAPGHDVVKDDGAGREAGQGCVCACVSMRTFSHVCVCMLGEEWFGIIAEDDALDGKAFIHYI